MALARRLQVALDTPRIERAALRMPVRIARGKRAHDQAQVDVRSERLRARRTVHTDANERALSFEHVPHPRHGRRRLQQDPVADRRPHGTRARRELAVQATGERRALLGLARRDPVLAALLGNDAARRERVRPGIETERDDLTTKKWREPQLVERAERMRGHG